MLLGRLRVRQKLVLLVLPLLLLAIAGAVPLVAGRVQAAERSGDAARTVERAVRIGALVQELQQERLESLGYLSGSVSRERIVSRTARVQELAAQLRTDYAGGDTDLAVVLSGIQSTAGLGLLRNQVLDRMAKGIDVYTGFSAATNGLIGGLRLTGTSDLRTDAGRQQLALDSITRHDEATAAEGAALFIEPNGRISTRVVSLVSRGRALEDREEDVFKPLARPDALELYEQVGDGQSSTRLNSFLDTLLAGASTRIDTVVVPDLQPQVASLTGLNLMVETRVAAQAVAEADRSARTDRWLAGLGLGIALLLLIGATVLSVLITRSIVRPLRRLTASADEVADVAQRELVRVADTDDPEEAVPQLRPVQVGTADEMGELAQAFNRVQQVASSLVERQLVSRQNVATMFGNVGRRTQNLVGRQLAMIDLLERNEQDPALLDRLYRLDHVSTRLRRNANSLVVLSGATDQQITGEPLTVADTIRSALGEIEGFQRVRLGEVDSALLTPNVTADVILLLAELLENGTSFSPPHTEVQVDAQAFAGGGVTIRIVDHGLGMTTEQLAAENGRLVSRERLDLAPTDVLGLFVVGRLARRHGIEVLLAPTPGTGVTAEVRVPARHVVRSEAPAVVEPVVEPVVVPVPAPAEEGDGRGWWDGPAAESVALAAPAVDPGTSLFRSGGRRVPPVEAEPVVEVGPEPVGEVAAPAEVRPEPAVAEPAAETLSPAAVVATPEPPAEVRAAEVRAAGVEVPVGAEDLPVVSGAEVARDVPRPRGAAGMVRRVRGAQHPDTGAPHRPDPPVLASPASADDARQEIEDFEEGVRRALRETGADGGAGFVVDAEGAAAPWTDLDPDDPQSAEQTRARVEEFEDGVRRALARLDEVAARPVPPAPLFEATNGVVPVPRQSPEPSTPPEPTPQKPEAAEDALPRRRPTEGVPPVPRRLDAGAGATRSEPAGRGRPDPRPLERRRPPEGTPAGAADPATGVGPAGLPRRRKGTAEPGSAGSRTNEASPNGRTGTPSDAGKMDAAGDDDLVLRVPGAQLPAGDRGARPETSAQQNGAEHDRAGHDRAGHDGAEHDGAEHHPAEQDASAARSLVEEFEAGVQRALRLGGDQGTAETDEEDVR